VPDLMSVKGKGKDHQFEYCISDPLNSCTTSFLTKYCLSLFLATKQFLLWDTHLAAKYHLTMKNLSFLEKLRFDEKSPFWQTNLVLTKEFPFWCTNFVFINKHCFYEKPL
jgi:hypothetical protein